jgi:SSS family transporter
MAVGMLVGRRPHTSQQYFLGGQQFGPLVLLISIVATETSTVTFLSVPGLAFREGGNLTFLQLAIGLVVGRIVIAVVLVPLYFSGQFISAYEILQTRFGPTVQRVSAALFLVTRTLADGLRLFLTALLLQQLMGCQVVPAIVLLTAGTLLYTYWGGMRAVVWTDVVQWCVYMGGAVLTLVLLLGQVDGGWQKLYVTAAAAGKWQLWEWRWDWHQPYTLWAGIVGGIFLTMGTHGADQLTVQRLLCARSVGAARWALIGSGLVVLAQFALFLLIGVALFVVLHLGSDSRSMQTPLRPDSALAYYIVHGMPTGVIGVLVAAVLAAAMSTLSSSLNSSAGVVVRDFGRWWYPQATEQQQVRWGRWVTVGFSMGQASVAVVAAYGLEESVINAVLSIAGWTTGGVLGLFLLGRRQRPPGPAAALTGLLCGLTAVAVCWWSSNLAWTWWAPLGTTVTIMAALVGERLLRLRERLLPRG